MIDIQKNVKLSNYTTFHLGGVARYFVEVSGRKDLRGAISFAKKKNIPFFILGEGSDILVSDKNFEGLIIRLVNENIDIKKNSMTAGAGVKWDDLVAFCVDKNLQGIECLSGIPGTVGASPVQNIGAYGQELKDTLKKVEVYDSVGRKFIFLRNKDCKFGYRESIFKDKNYKGRYIIYEVIFKLKKDGLPNISYESLKDYLGTKDVSLRDVRNAILEIRSQKLDDPKETGNAGSFFKNPIVSDIEFKKIQRKFPDIPNFKNNNGVKLFAGWLIEQCGWKGKRYKKVGVSNKNALVIVKHAGGTAEQVCQLSKKITADVYEKFGIKLEPEVQFINF